MGLFDVVFEGGGAKGIAFVGALEAFSAAGHTPRRLIGTSAGAISATLVAAGFTSAELRAAVTERAADGRPRFATFLDRPTANEFSPELIKNSETMKAVRAVHIPGMVGGGILQALLATPIYAQLFSIVECGGFFAGQTFLAWLHEKLGQKGLKAEVTFAEFHRQGGADLSVVASDTADEELLVLNHRTAPQCPVAWAVRMSMSIPFLWQAVVWQQEWGLYLQRPKVGNAIVDGGVLSNFPISLIAEKTAATIPIMGETDPNAARNLGLLIDETLAVPGRPADTHGPKLADHLQTVQRARRLLDTMMQAKDNDAIRQHAAEICHLPAQGYGTTEFDMTPERLEALIAGGRQAMDTYLRTLESR